MNAIEPPCQTTCPVSTSRSSSDVGRSEDPPLPIASKAPSGDNANLLTLATFQLFSFAPDLSDQTVISYESSALIQLDITTFLPSAETSTETSTVENDPDEFLSKVGFLCGGDKRN